MDVNPLNRMIKSKTRDKVSEISDDTEGGMKEFLLGLKDKLENEDKEEERHQKPEFPESLAQSKKSIFSEVIFELEESALNHITNA